MIYSGTTVFTTAGDLWFKSSSSKPSLEMYGYISAISTSKSTILSFRIPNSINAMVVLNCHRNFSSPTETDFHGEQSIVNNTFTDIFICNNKLLYSILKMIWCCSFPIVRCLLISRYNNFIYMNDESVQDYKSEKLQKQYLIDSEKT